LKGGDKMNTLELKSARIKRGLTQVDIAEKMNISSITYSLKERGKRDFTINEVSNIIKILNLSLLEINAIFFDNQLIVKENQR
jgi:putative transcriptional regulator